MLKNETFLVIFKHRVQMFVFIVFIAFIQNSKKLGRNHKNTPEFFISFVCHWRNYLVVEMALIFWTIFISVTTFGFRVQQRFFFYDHKKLE